MAERGTIPIHDSAVIRWTFGERADGDLSISQPPNEVANRRERQHRGPWLWLRQVHGDVIVDARGASVEGCGAEADGVFTDSPGMVLAVHTADCCPVLMWSSTGKILVGAVHAGWRGLAEGAIERLAESIRNAGGSDLQAMLGPCICPACYEFGSTELDLLARRFGDGVRGTARSGAPSLDVRAAVRAACSAADTQLVHPVTVDSPSCTAHGSDHFSHRARAEAGRQASTIELCQGREGWSL